MSNMFRDIVFKPLNIQLIDVMLKTDNTFLVVNVLTQVTYCIWHLPGSEVYSQWEVKQARNLSISLYHRNFNYIIIKLVNLESYFHLFQQTWSIYTRNIPIMD